MLVRNVASINFLQRCLKIKPAIYEQSLPHSWIITNLSANATKKASTLPAVTTDLGNKLNTQTAVPITSRLFCSANSIPVAEYNEIKDLPNHPEKFLIDVREPGELAKYGIIPTSINIPLDTLEETLTSTGAKESFKTKFQRKYPDINSEIIFSCMRGVRAQKASEIAKLAGFRNVKNYKGSWIDWAEHEGIPIPS